MASDGRGRLVRQNSSFLGTIKHIVTAPLSWLAPPDSTPKRRRSPPAPADDDDDHAAARQPKRIRRASPHLDPPRAPSVVPRAASAVLPSTRATASPRRHHGLSRTMSIDPSFDAEMRLDRLPSGPPSPRPSFRMRSSLTPQPQLLPARYISEPPPLSSLVSNPTFLHPPPPPPQHLPHLPSPPPTLGSLVDSVRSTRSHPKQQRSTLLLSSHPTAPEIEDKDAPAERALQQLDVYKTPLLPTRLRSSNIPASVTAATTPDLFKSRRSSHLVLMQDDRDRLAGRSSGKSPVLNETKPYAGEGGMKKLLARRKLEEQEDSHSDTASPDLPVPPRPPHSSHSPSAPPQAPPPSDWFSTAASGSSTSGSSLRVGRTKTSRNHIQRPSKARFSAVYEEEPDDVMDQDEDRQKERQILDEAAKKAPLFQIPADFSFAKDVPPVKPVDLDAAKEPPIAALPFSFAKPTTTPAPSAAPSVAADSKAVDQPPAPALSASPAPSAGGIPNFFASSQVLTKAKESAVPTPPLNFGLPATLPSDPASSTQPVKDVNNPFWNGEKKNTAIEPKSGFSLFSGPSKPDESKSLTPSAASAPSEPVSVFASVPKLSTEPTAPLSFSFGKPAEVPTAVGESKASELPFSFGRPAETKKDEVQSVAPPAPKPLFGAGSSVFGDASKLSGGLFGEPSKPATSLPVEQPESAASTLEEKAKAVGSLETSAPPQPTPSPLPFTFGAPPTDATPANPSTVPATAPQPTPQPNFFGAPASTTIEAPKPLFGGGGNSFSFGPSQPADKEKEVKSVSPFSFGAPATPTERPAESKPSSVPMFTFGQPSTVTPAPVTNSSTQIPFSFSSGGSTAGDVSNKTPFMFGQPTSLAPTDRPVTPPKTNEQDSRMEESPTRDLQQLNGNKVASNLSGGFPFGPSGSTTNGGTPFGGGQSTAPSFSFGAPTSSSASNPFAPKDNADGTASKGFGGFGQNVTPISTSFSFSQPVKAAEEAQRPSTASGFSFGATPTSATSAAPAFSFGAPPASNPFGQTNSGSSPSSPSTFNQPTPFSFSATAPSSNAPFTFGSQPNSPAGGTNLTLPAGGFGGGASFGQTQQQPSSPFSAPIALAPSTSGGGGGSLFTIGAAPAPSPSGARQIKKLPNRRGGAKR